MENNGWISIGEGLPPDGMQVDFYSIDVDDVICGTKHGERWFDEANCFTSGRASEVIGVTHWRPRPKRPFEE